MNYYRVQVALAHLGTHSTEYDCWHIATKASAVDVKFNAGHMLPGVRDVSEVEAVTESQYNAVRRQGGKAFEVQAR